ncbi:NADPH-dependent F420 reductase [Actinoplanes sp. N902-109]|uniref:NADPH-dependent F420 reductase n=1 Tax=Actinoplanes sp. (strain N902-109) TaxID=649831 RepID=UPI00032948F1|nr:NAD(P)-binding domain-containing protein [Actinoplanes sp. N902-109]AGL15916.1 coenzyme F420-dependent NADP oxidoreductase [Actinoplanes sp. N902-109]
MTTVGFIGSGNIGSTVARLAVAAGYDVVLSNSRGPGTLADLVAQIGPNARAATAAEAASAGDIVVVSVPFKAYQDLPVEQLAGKLVLDTNNYYPQRDGNFPELDNGETTSAELEQKQLGSAQLVKVFNNIYFKHLGSLARPAGAADRTALTIAGDDSKAKQTATAFLNAIGYDTVDVGPLAESWRVEPDRPAYGGPYGSFEDPAGTPADVAKVRAAVAEAQR